MVGVTYVHFAYNFWNMVMDKFQLSPYESAGLGYDFDFIYSLLANNYSILVLGFREMVFCFKNCFDLLPTVRKNCSSDLIHYTIYR